MKAISYYHDPGIPAYPSQLIYRWRKSFLVHGFEPVILTESDARAHPRFNEVLDMVSRFPTVNDRTYENACWLRWLAFELASPGLILDYDVINYGFYPDQVPQEEFFSLDAYCGPGVVHATAEGIRKFVAEFPKAMECVLPGPHVSDMLVFNQYPKASRPVCVFPDATNSRTAPLVHFPNARAPEGQGGNNRYLWVDEFTKWREKP